MPLSLSLAYSPFQAMFYKVLVMKELNLGSRIVGFFMEFRDLLVSNLDLATLSLSLFDISMLFYEK